MTTNQKSKAPTNRKAYQKLYQHTRRHGPNRLRTLGMDAVYRAAAERRFREMNPDYIDILPQSLEDFKDFIKTICS